MSQSLLPFSQGTISAFREFSATYSDNFSMILWIRPWRPESRSPSSHVAATAMIFKPRHRSLIFRLGIGVVNRVV